MLLFRVAQCAVIRRTVALNVEYLWRKINYKRKLMLHKYAGWKLDPLKNRYKLFPDRGYITDATLHL